MANGEATPSTTALTEWPLRAPGSALELGCLIDCPGSQLTQITTGQLLGRPGAGWWQCQLTDETLTWTAGVFQIFGLPHGTQLSRADILQRYTEESRVKMERLRAYAIRTGRGFALDAQVIPVGESSTRWMRLLGSPVLEDGKAVKLQGVKLLR